MKKNKFLVFLPYLVCSVIILNLTIICYKNFLNNGELQKANEINGKYEVYQGIILEKKIDRYKSYGKSSSEDCFYVKLDCPDEIIENAKIAEKNLSKDYYFCEEVNKYENTIRIFVNDEYYDSYEINDDIEIFYYDNKFAVNELTLYRKNLDSIYYIPVFFILIEAYVVIVYLKNKWNSI